MRGWHCTTRAKLARYKATGGILPPVRFWRYESSARDWAKRKQRTVVLQIEVDVAHPLPDHKPSGHAWWSNQIVRKWRDVTDVA